MIGLREKTEKKNNPREQQNFRKHPVEEDRTVSIPTKKDKNKYLMIKVKWQNMQTDRNQGKEFHERDTKRNIKYFSRVKDPGKTLAFSQFAIRKSVLNFR